LIVTTTIVVAVLIGNMSDILRKRYTKAYLDSIFFIRYVKTKRLSIVVLAKHKCLIIYKF